MPKSGVFRLFFRLSPPWPHGGDDSALLYLKRQQNECLGVVWSLGGGIDFYEVKMSFLAPLLPVSLTTYKRDFRLVTCPLTGTKPVFGFL